MPGFVRMTMLIIKTQQSACLTGFFCCLFLPTTLATLPPNGFSEFGGDLFVSCSKVLWGYGHHFPAEKKALSALFTSPRCPGTSLDVFQAALEAHAVAPWPKKQSPLCLLGAPWSLASPAASLSICPPALGSEKVLFPEMSKHGLWLALQSSPGLLLLFLFTGSISENISEGQHECSISVSWLSEPWGLTIHLRQSSPQCHSTSPADVPAQLRATVLSSVQAPVFKSVSLHSVWDSSSCGL